MTCFHTPLHSPLRPQREKDWTPLKDQSKTLKKHQELPKPKQQYQEDHPHHSDSQWVVVSTDWVNFNSASSCLLSTIVNWMNILYKREKQHSKQRSSVRNDLSLSMERRVQQFQRCQSFLNWRQRALIRAFFFFWSSKTVNIKCLILLSQHGVFSMNTA